MASAIKEDKTMTRFETLPVEVQNKIKDTLKAYDSVFVSYENGEYHFGICIKRIYAADHKVIGEFYAKDIYSEEERILNYVDTFHAYPIQYKGKRDYTILKNYGATYKMVDGNIEIA